MNLRRAVGGLGRCVALALAMSAFACGSDSLVGGGCREGLSECSLKCVDLRADQANCGVCGHSCAAGQVCSAGTCSGAVSDASDDGADASTNDGALGDGALGDGALGDGALGDGSGDAGDGGPLCTPPFDTAERCGDCNTKCAEPTPVCGLQGTFKCLSRCEAPLVACGAYCINTFSDDKNCGMCGKVCASGICQSGKCVGKGFGHEIIIGMDDSDDTLSQASAQVELLGNAVFLGGNGKVRVLAYDEFADPATVARIQTWIMAEAMQRGRMVTLTSSSGWGALPEELAVTKYEVLLVYDQLLAPRDQMATSGTLWNGAMSAYAKGGGIIVVLDGGSAGRMRDLLNNGGLLPVSDESDVTGTQVTVDAPTDVVGLNLPNVFAAKKSTVAFTTSQVADNLHVFVVKDMAMRPVVIHSVPAQ
jgi:stigma-specific protein Stig1